MECILEAESLVKRFKGVTAVDGVDISVRRGEIFGFLGPNGAGKTTTVRILSTLTNFDEGQVVVDGFDIRKDPNEAKTRMGVIQQHISLDKDLTVRENMYHRALMQQMPKEKRDARMKELVEYFSLEKYMDRKIDSLSGGWKKRVAIVSAMVHSPKVIFLDEPTAGLDIKARRLLWELIRLLNKDGTTVFLTTHYIEEAESLCDRVAIIDRGRIRRLGSPGEICDSIGRVTLEFEGEDRSMQYRFFPDRESARTFAAGLDGRNPRMRRTVLEDAFLEITGRKSPDDSAKAVRAPR